MTRPTLRRCLLSLALLAAPPLGGCGDAGDGPPGEAVQGGGGATSSAAGGNMGGGSAGGGDATTASTTSGAGGAGGDPANILFRSHWDTEGNSLDAITDGGRWDNTVCVIPDGQGSTLIQNIMSVVPGGPVGWSATPNVMRITQRGATMCGNIETMTSISEGQSFYARMYVRYDDNQWNFHPVTLNCCGSIQGVLWASHDPAGSTYRPVISITGDNPWRVWGPPAELPKGQWYRFEWHVEFVAQSQARVWPRVYDMQGALVADATTYRNTWTNERTLAEHYALGHVHEFSDADLARRFGLGYEGNALAEDTGLHWYYAAVEVRADGWPGPVGP
jgi:hypothetical protein